MAEGTTGSILRGKVKKRAKRTVSFMVPEEVDGNSSSMDVEEDEIEPLDPESRVPVPEEPVRHRRDVHTSVNCYLLDQRTRISIMGLPLSDLVFSLLSVLLVTGSNLLLVINCVSMVRHNDSRYLYVLGFLLADRLAAAFYRGWSAPATRGRVHVLLDVLVTSLFLDGISMGLSLLSSADPDSTVNVCMAEGSAKSRKQWTALPFLSAPGHSVTRMKMMCLLSAASHSWQILGLIAALADKQRYHEQRERLQILASIACSTTLLCWAVTISLPTVPVPQLFSSGYWIVLRTILKLCWLLCIATSRLLACYWFSEAMGVHLYSFAAAHWAACLLYSLVTTRCCLHRALRPTQLKLALASSVYLVVFAHPQRGHLDQAYGVAHILYLCEDVLMVYGTRDVAGDDVTWVLAGAGVFSLGVIFFLCLMILNITVRHPTVHADAS